MNASSQHSAERINPFHFHPMKFFQYQDTVIQFKAEWKILFAYLASLQNKFGHLYLNTESLDAQLGLGVDIVLSAECIIRDFKTLGILTEHEVPHRKNYLLLHPIELKSCATPFRSEIGSLHQLFPTALSQREYQKSFDIDAYFDKHFPKPKVF